MHVTARMSRSHIHCKLQRMLAAREVRYLSELERDRAGTVLRVGAQILCALDHVGDGVAGLAGRLAVRDDDDLRVVCAARSRNGQIVLRA